MKEILYKGKLLKITFEKSILPNTIVIHKADSLLIKLSAFVNPDKDKDKIYLIIKNWLKNKAYYELKNKTDYFASIYGFSYNKLRVKDTKTRWGSCSAKNNLNFNWRLIMAPEYVLDYIIIHETAHLTELNHSKKFWNLVKERYPNYKEAESWLKNNGKKLFNCI